MPEALLADIVRATPGLVFVNAYGPTEVTVYATPIRFRRADAPDGNASDWPPDTEHARIS